MHTPIQIRPSRIRRVLLGATISEMRRLRVLRYLLFVMAALVLWSNTFGLGDYNLYEKLFWWDIVAHVLGGFAVALGYTWFVEYINAPYHPRFIRRIITASGIQRLKLRSTILSCVLAALFVGILWEYFEYVIDLQGSPFLPAAAEIVKDLVDDVIGGFMAGYFINRSSRR